ncbi:MAG: amidohydrolase family protein [Alphaproteobacteria bacterium]|nr:amidohydrolase family protein [Alphaproteobacteria bacterium]
MSKRSTNLNAATSAAIAATLSISLAPAAARAADVLIDNGRLHLLTGADHGDVLATGDILVRDGRIVEVAAEIPAPDGASVIDASGSIVTPGFIAAWSQIGLVEIGLDAEANDASPEGPFALSAALDARDAFNSASTLIPISRAGGITRALSAPTPGAKMFGGQAAIVALDGDPATSIVRGGAAQSVVLGYGGAARAGDTRMGAWGELRAYVAEARAFAVDPESYRGRTIDLARFSLADLEALRPVISGEQLLIAQVHGAAEIRTLLRFAATEKIKVAILGGDEAWVVADEIAAAGAPVILDPLSNLPGNFHRLGATLENAARLQAAGVKIAFEAPGTHNLRLLPQSAGNAVANGLPFEAALAALTINPAEILGIGSEVGTIEPGKIADLVIWNGDPLELSSRPTAVLINGEPQSLETRSTKLRDRYADPKPSARPLAYPADE